jgi:hypothetical protein
LGLGADDAVRTGKQGDSRHDGTAKETGRKETSRTETANAEERGHRFDVIQSDEFPSRLSFKRAHGNIRAAA